MLQQIWQKALLDSIKYTEKMLWETKITDTISAFSVLEVEKSLLTIKPQNFIKRTPCRRIAL